MESSVQEERYIVEELSEHYGRIFVLMGRVGDAITERRDAQLSIEDFAKSAEKQLMEEEEFLGLGPAGPAACLCKNFVYR